MGKVRPSEVEVDVGSPWRLVIVGALVLVTCDPGAAPGGAGASAQVQLPGYAPNTVGDTWTYRTTQVAPGLVMPGATSTDRIVSGAPAGARWIGRLVSEDAANPGANSERGLILEAGAVSPDIGTMTTTIGPVTTVRSSGVYLPADLSPGLRWSWTQTIDSPISMMDVAGSAEVVGAAKVTVPAGTFEAVMVRSEVVNHVVSKAGTIPPIDHVQRDESWYVRGLGLVKNVTRAGAGYSAEKVLVRYSVQGAPVGGQVAQIAAGTP